MKVIQLIKNNIPIVFLLTIAAVSYAGAPVWTFTPLTATTISVPSNDTALVPRLVNTFSNACRPGI